MIECATIEEALRVPGVIRIEAGEPVRAYVLGDELPLHLLSDEERAAQSGEGQ